MHTLVRSYSESPKRVLPDPPATQVYHPLQQPLDDHELLRYNSIKCRRCRRLYSSTDKENCCSPRNTISGKRFNSVTDEPYNNAHKQIVFVSGICIEPASTGSLAPMAFNSTQTSQQLNSSAYRHHASFSEPSSSTPSHTAQVLRRESMTRMFLKPDAVFKAYEEIQQQQVQRNPSSQRIKRYTSVDDEPVYKIKLEPEVFNDASNSQPSLKTNPLETQTTCIRRLSSITQSSVSSQFTVEARRRCSAFVAMIENLKKENPEEVYKIKKQLGTGRFGYVKLAEHKASHTTVALKFFPRPQTKQTDFLREYNFSKFLSPHQHIIDTFSGIYQAFDDSAFYFVQEFAPHASLREMVEASEGGISEAATKSILLSVVSAIEFMHMENLVHRNLKAENILIFSLEDLSRVKVTDFGLTRKEGSTVKNLDYTSAYHAPELVDTVVNEFLTVYKSIDIWTLGIIFYYCLKGKHPWQKASIICKPYFEWDQWLKHKLPQLPRRYDVFTEKAIKLQKRCLIGRAKDRWTCKDLKRYLEKERLLKPIKIVRAATTENHYKHQESDKKSKSTIHSWISSTLNMVTEISEQVVSARDE